MSYALYADEWPMQMIRLRLDRSDRHLFTELLSHCTRNLSDGVIDVPLALITDHPEASAGVARLIEAGLVAEHPDGYLIADYAQHQRTKEQVDKDREKNRRYQEEYRERGRRHAEGDHRICTKGCKDSGKDLRKDPTKEVQSNPLLSDHKGGERGEGKGTSDEPTGLAPVGLASDPSGVHVFADYELTGICRVCEMPEANKRHQRKVPGIVAKVAQVFADRGMACKASTNDDHDGTTGWLIMAETAEVDFQLETDYSDGAKATRLGFLEMTVKWPGLPDLDEHWPATFGESWDEWIASIKEHLSRVTWCSVDFDDEGLMYGRDGFDIVARTPRDLDMLPDLGLLLDVVPLFRAKRQEAEAKAPALTVVGGS